MRKGDEAMLRNSDRCQLPEQKFMVENPVIKESPLLAFLSAYFVFCIFVEKFRLS